MARVHRCLRRLTVAYNLFFAVAGGLVVVVSLALLSPSMDGGGGSDFEHQTARHILLYVGGSVAVVIAILGAYGALKENPVALTVYLVCAVTGGLLMLRAAVQAAATRPELQRLMEGRWRSVLPLDRASGDVQEKTAALQTTLHCCGLFSYEDWGQNIPDSCLCNREEEAEGKCQTAKYKNFLFNLFWQKKSVFTQTCFPLILDSAKTNVDLTLGSVVALFVLALLGSLLSSLMIHQMFFTSSRLPAPERFSDQPPTYQQLFNLPEDEAKTATT